MMPRVLLPAFPQLWQHVFAQGLLSRRTSPLHSPPPVILGNSFRSSTYFGYHSWLGQFLKGELVLRHWASRSGIDAHLETAERHARCTNCWGTGM